VLNEVNSRDFIGAGHAEADGLLNQPAKCV